ncbi:hypothetical protein NMG60_11003200 [Bertholletia excelsa]
MRMDKTMLKTTFFFASLLISLFSSSSAQTCTSYTFSSNKLYSNCSDLPYLNSYLHWTYHSANSTVDIAYRHTSVDTLTWVAWALNPSGTQMIGAQSLVALHNSSGVPHAYTSAVTSYQTTLQESTLSFTVPTLTAEYVSGEMIIYATLELPSGQTSFQQVWQAGPVSNGQPGRHPTTGANMQSVATIDFSTGSTTATGGGGSQQRKKNIHGVLNAVSWGVMMPIGVTIARYLKVFKSADPAWFYLHVACQSSAYIIGVAGWGTGMKLGADSGVEHKTHRNIGITLFCLGTLQVFALLLRPKKEHKLRFYWNLYHWATGYAVIILSIINILEGFKILDPENKDWKKAYIGFLIAIGSVAAALEAFTWYVVLKRKKTGDEKYPHTSNGQNGVNGYGRSHV